MSLSQATVRVELACACAGSAPKAPNAAALVENFRNARRCVLPPMPPTLLLDSTQPIAFHYSQQEIALLEHESPQVHESGHLRGVRVPFITSHERKNGTRGFSMNTVDNVARVL